MKPINVEFLYNEKNEDIFAFFPSEVFDSKGNLMCYSIIGQHSACSMEYAKESRRANKAEYEALYNELESIGYNMRILN